MKFSKWKAIYFISSGVIGFFLTAQMALLYIDVGGYNIDGKFLLAKHGWSAIFGIVFGSILGLLFTFYSYTLTRLYKRLMARIGRGSAPTSSFFGVTGEVISILSITAFFYASYLTGEYMKTLGGAA